MSQEAVGVPSALSGVFSVPSTLRHKTLTVTATSGAINGHLPRTGFLKTIRSTDFNTTVVFSEAVIKADMKSCRMWVQKEFVYHKVSAGGATSSSSLFQDDCVLWSSKDVEEDWLIDDDAVNVKMTDQRHLSRYPLEELLAVEMKKPLLLFVGVDTGRRTIWR